jgi:microcystin degradation protein MlrC
VGYPWADVSIQGASVLVITYGNQSLADAYAKNLAKKMWDLRRDFQFHIYSMQQAVKMGMESEEMPFFLDELCDCTLGGASGDVVSSVRYLVENGVKNAVAVGIVDPESVSTAVKAGVGTTVRLAIGGKYCKEDNPPFDFEGKVTRIAENIIGDGTIHSGFETLVGKVAVVEGQGIEIVLIEYPGKIGGPSFLEKLGINPKEKKFIISKEGLNPLVTYKDTAAKILMVDSPGFNRQKLRVKDYKKVIRPIYPLDPDMVVNEF